MFTWKMAVFEREREREREREMLTMVTYIVRMAISLVYYGLSLSAGELAGNRYVNIFLSGLVEMPAYVVFFFMLQK